ncbi:MAG: hypothetical protein AAF362_13040 [Pseudomonadota bacterium]
MISIIIVGRNDNYGGDFEDRLFATVSYNIAELRRRNISFELVFVEWNPISDRPLLSSKIVDRFEEARCVVVDEMVHGFISQNKHIKVFEYHAKNVGAYHALGDWLLLTNPDNYFGRDIFDFLETGQFESESFYRAGWVNIDDQSGVDAAGSHDRYVDSKPPFFHAAGDFILCSKKLFDRVGGFREDLAFTNTHKDSVLCLSFFDITTNVRKIGNTFHLRHERDDASNRRIRFDWTKVKRVPQSTYGHADLCISNSVAPRVERLSLKEELQLAARKKKPVNPVIPMKYRKERGWIKSVRRLARGPFNRQDP